MTPPRGTSGRSDRAISEAYTVKGRLHGDRIEGVFLSGQTDGINANGLGFKARVLGGDPPSVDDLPGKDIDMVIDLFSLHPITGQVVWGRKMERNGSSDEFDLFLGIRFLQIPQDLRDKIQIIVSEDVKRRMTTSSQDLGLEKKLE